MILLVIDFHAHILPEVDDGSKSLEMSLAMLREEHNQGVDVVVATPHFYANSITLQKFLLNRNQAYLSIKESQILDLPKIILGAEVAMFPKMDMAEDIKSLCIENTNAMLIEMPFRQWLDEDVRVLSNLIAQGIVPIIAHIERYIKYQKQKKCFETIIELPLYVQVNAEGFESWRVKRILIEMFNNGFAHLLGSDCHNLSDMKPNLLNGRDVIKRKIGNYQLDIIDEIGFRILGLQETR